MKGARAQVFKRCKVTRPPGMEGYKRVQGHKGPWGVGMQVVYKTARGERVHGYKDAESARV